MAVIDTPVIGILWIFERRGLEGWFSATDVGLLERSRLCWSKCSDSLGFKDGTHRADAGVVFDLDIAQIPCVTTIDAISRRHFIPTTGL